jgi:hypothetical protein
LVRIKTLKRIDHIGIVAVDMNKYATIFQKLGGTPYFRGYSKKYDAECLFIKFKNVDIELIRGGYFDTYHINTWNQRLHHIAIEGKGKYKGAKKGMLVNFNKPNKRNNILIEKVQYE